MKDRNMNKMYIHECAFVQNVQQLLNHQNGTVEFKVFQLLVV